MTFKHKLSARLALLKGIALLATAVVACTVADQTVSGPSRSGSPARTATAGTILFQENFEDNAFAGRGWYDNSAMAITDSEHVAGSTHALEVHFRPGATTPTWGGAARHLFTASPTLYISYWVKYSDNWIGSGQPYHPHEFLVLSDLDGDYDGPSDNWLTAYVEENYQNGGIPRIQLQDSKAINTSFGAPPINLVATTENRSVDGCNGVVEPNVVTSCFSFPPWYNDKEFSPGQVAFQPTPGPGYKGNWNHVEAYLQINSIASGIGQADGVVQYWFNGQLMIDRHDVLFRTAARASINFHQFLIAPFIGDGSPADQYMWIDNLTVATAPLTSAPSVASVAVTPAASSVTAGSSTQFTATLKDSAGNVLSGQAVAWTSTNTAVATVDGNGLATGVAAGSDSIRATAGGVTGAAALAVTAPASDPGTVTTLAATGSTDTSVTLRLTEVDDGTGHPASYNVRFAAGAISWGSANDVTRGTCKVPMAGTAIGATRTCTVLGLAPSTAYQFQLVAYRGTLNVNAVFGGLSNVASQATTAPLAAIAVTPATASIAVGGTQAFTATAKDAAGNVLAGRTIAWASSNTGVATMSGHTATGRAAGSATISASSGTVKGTASLTVGAPAASVASVTVAPASVSQLVGATRQFTATLKDSAGNVLTGRTVTWTSSKASVASVTAAGLETGVAQGTATITASSGGKSGTSAITVTPAGNPQTVTDLAVSGSTDSSITVTFTEVTDGAGKPASYEMRFAAGTLSWGSASDVSLGSCKVPIAGTAIGAKRSCTLLGLNSSTAYQVQVVAFRGTLNVNAVFGPLSRVASGTTAGSSAPVASVTVSPSAATVPMGGGQQLAATLRDANGNVLTGRSVTWATSAASTAAVSGGGMVTGMAAGNATITATSEGQSGAAAVTVSTGTPSGTWANEPSGFSLISDYAFGDALPLVNDGPVGTSGWKIINPDNGQPLTAGHAVSAVDATAPMGSSIAQFLYPVGMRDGYAPATMYTDGFSANALYAGFWWKPSAQWQTDGSGVNKIAFMFIGGSTMYISMNWNGSVYHLRVEDEINSPTTNYDPNVTLTPITLGQWHKVEWYVSTTGGTKFWLDGVLQGSYPNLRWSSPFTMFQFSPTWGGNGGDVKNELDSYSYNHVHLSKQ
ncbi:MAG TPA: Ig-like domain-containing protein [Gemmatimonadales bacterium]|nr:Ig-like domain-containing protein [Gemmatimonadales bacterium]